MPRHFLLQAALLHVLPLHRFVEIQRAQRAKVAAELETFWVGAIEQVWSARQWQQSLGLATSQPSLTTAAISSRGTADKIAAVAVCRELTL